MNTEFLKPNKSYNICFGLTIMNTKIENGKTLHITLNLQ